MESIYSQICRRIGNVRGGEGSGHDQTGVSGMLTEKGRKAKVLEEKQGC